MLPLAVGVPTAGSYSLTASAIDNLPAGLTPYLRDAQTGTTTALAAGTSYVFAVTSAQAQALLLGRFTVQFAPAAPLAATSAALAASVSVYPNPARAQATVAMPGLAGTTAVQVELLNAPGPGGAAPAGRPARRRHPARAAHGRAGQRRVRGAPHGRRAARDQAPDPGIIYQPAARTGCGWFAPASFTNC